MRIRSCGLGRRWKAAEPKTGAASVLARLRLHFAASQWGLICQHADTNPHTMAHSPRPLGRHAQCLVALFQHTAVRRDF